MEFAYGADLGWVSQLEAEGFSWVDDHGSPIDPIEAAVRMGTNAIRLRIFVDPPAEAYWDKTSTETCMLGYCKKESVLRMAKRVKRAGLRLMLTIHYSDHFSDPGVQDIPHAWLDDDYEAMVEHVREHTLEVVRLFSEGGVLPDWIQVGNEINFGLLWPMGRLEKNPDQLVGFLNAGYDAVKEVLPGCPVITHMSEIQNPSRHEPFLDNFFTKGGKTDIIGFSYYPYWVRMEFPDFEHDQERLIDCFKNVYEKYSRPIMLCEIGGPDTEPKETRSLISDAIKAVKELPNEAGLGVFYWEPEVCSLVLPDRYPLGAAYLAGEKKLSYTEALMAFKDA